MHVIPSTTHGKHSYYTEMSVCPFIQTSVPTLGLSPTLVRVCVCVGLLITCVFTGRVKWGRMGLFISRKALNHHVVYGSGKRKCSHLEENLGTLKRTTSSCWHNLIYLFTGYCPRKPLAAWPRLGYIRPNCTPLWNSVESFFTPLDFFFPQVCQVSYVLTSPWELHFPRSFAEFSPFGKTLQELSHALLG